jgi:glycerol-3-phosphate dehydrogenase (NAD(P)+)
MKMVAEGYTASKCIHSINERVAAEIPIADAIYRILWENAHPAEEFKKIEEVLV